MITFIHHSPHKTIVMKSLLIFSLSALALLSSNQQNKFSEKTNYTANTTAKSAYFQQPAPLVSVPQKTRLRAAEFKAQDFCRLELKDFDFDAKFRIVSATVYFSGANFKDVMVATINSSSLNPIKAFMNRCIPGTVVSFDNIKVEGPDKEIRNIDGVTYVLY